MTYESRSRALRAAQESAWTRLVHVGKRVRLDEYEEARAAYEEARAAALDSASEEGK